MPAEIIRDAILLHSIDLQKYDTNTLRDIIASLNNLRDDLTSVIQNGVEGGGSYSAKIARAEALKAQATHYIDLAYAQIEGTHVAALSGMAGVETQFAIQSVNSAIGVNLANVMLTQPAIDLIVGKAVIEGAPSADWWKRQNKILVDKFSDEMTKGIVRGETIQQLTQRVRGTRANKFKDGIMDTTKARAEAIVRTSGMTISNQIRASTYGANADIIKGIQWVATLDHSVCLKCAPLDGLTWTFPEFKPQGHNKQFLSPPAHWNCRCTTVPILKSYRELAGLPDAKKIKESTRSSLQGQVAESTKFENWIKTQPEEAQKAVLGKARFQLWKSGKLSIQQMTTPSNEVLTLKQLEERVVHKSIRDAVVTAPYQNRIISDLKSFPKLTKNAQHFADNVPFSQAANAAPLREIGKRQLAVALNDSLKNLKDIEGFSKHVTGVRMIGPEVSFSGQYDGAKRLIELAGSPGSGGLDGVEVLKHEMAHALDHYFTLTSSPQAVYEKVWYINDELKRARKIASKFGITEESMAIPSKYAVQDVHEWVAEWFTQRSTNPAAYAKARKYYPAVNDWIDTWFVNP